MPQNTNILFACRPHQLGWIHTAQSTQTRQGKDLEDKKLHSIHLCRCRAHHFFFFFSECKCTKCYLQADIGHVNGIVEHVLRNILFFFNLSHKKAGLIDVPLNV